MKILTIASIITLAFISTHANAGGDYLKPLKKNEIRFAGVIKSIDLKSNSFILDIQGVISETISKKHRYLFFSKKRLKTIIVTPSDTAIISVTPILKPTSWGGLSSFSDEETPVDLKWLKPGMSVEVSSENNTGIGRPIKADSVHSYTGYEVLRSYRMNPKHLLSSNDMMWMKID